MAEAEAAAVAAAVAAVVAAAPAAAASVSEEKNVWTLKIVFICFLQVNFAHGCFPPQGSQGTH